MKLLATVIFSCVLSVVLARGNAYGAGDEESPELTSITGAPGTFGPGDTAAIAFTAFDTGGGVLDDVFMSFSTPTGDSLSVGGDPSLGELTIVIKEFDPAGVYTLRELQLRDTWGNVTSYFDDGTTYVTPYGATGPASHAFDFSAITFTVVNAGEDITHPALESTGGIAPGPYAAGETLSFAYTASDAGGSEVRDVYVTYEDTYGRQRTLFSSPGTTTSGPATWVIDSFWSSGVYSVTRITVIDNAGMEATYNADGTIDYYPDRAPPSTITHEYPFADYSFTVINPDGDSTAPKVISFDLADPTVKLGETAAMNFEVTDNGGSGTTLVAFQFIGPGGTYLELISFGSVSADSPATRSIGRDQPAGIYHLDRIILSDASFLNATLNADGTIELDIPGVGLTEHEFDFSEFVITVVDSRADANCDGSTDMGDVIQIRRQVAALALPVSDCDANVDGEGEVTELDALNVLRILAGLDPELALEVPS